MNVTATEGGGEMSDPSLRLTLAALVLAGVMDGVEADRVHEVLLGDPLAEAPWAVVGQIEVALDEVRSGDFGRRW